MMPIDVVTADAQNGADFVIENELNLEVPNYTEKPGLRKFFSLFGYPEMSNLTEAHAFGYQDIFKSLFGDQDSRDNLENLIEVIRDNDSNTPIIEIVDQITVYEPRTKIKKRQSDNPDIKISDAMEILADYPDADNDMTEVIDIIIDEVRDRAQKIPVDSATLDEILLEGTSRPERVRRLANILGIDSQELENKSLAQLLDYLSGLSKEIDEMRDFSLAESSYHVQRGFIEEVIMSDEVTPQTGVECVLYATLNLAQAAKNQEAFVGDVNIPEMERRIPTGQNTRYRTMGADWVDYMKEKGYNVSPDFNWGEDLTYLQQKKGGLIMRILDDHAIAVTGIRHNNDQPPKLEFLIANSLAVYPPHPPAPDKPVWVNAKEIMSQVTLLEPGEDTRMNIYLLSWDKLEE